MPIRLNKVTKDFNVGISTIAEFLKKKGLGEIDQNPNAKISDEQYAALQKEFSNDKDLAEIKDKILQNRQKKEKKVDISLEPARENVKTESQGPKILGKIDLDSLNKPKVEPKKEEVEPKELEPVESPKQEEKIEELKPEVKPEPKVETSAPEIEPEEETEVPTIEVPKEEVVSKPEVEVPVLEEEPAVAEEKVPTSSIPVPDKPKKNEIQTVEENGVTKVVPVYENKIKVLGTIDLSALNQSTHPKKKTKEERKKERDDRRKINSSQQNENNRSQDQRQGDSTKKRQRITKDQRVDVAAESKRMDNNGQRKDKSRNQGNNNGNIGRDRDRDRDRDKDRDRDRDQRNGKRNKNNRNDREPVSSLSFSIHDQVSDEDVAKQVKETLARLTGKQKVNKSGAKYRKEKRENALNRVQEELREEAAESKILKLTEFVTANELATMMNVSVNQVIGTCMSIGIMVSINQRLDAETINLVAEEFGYTTEYVSASVSAAVAEEDDKEEDLQPRAPIVTVMGHVDHGKTSLLDFIRNTNVIAGEAGGITQHIGAYNVKLPNNQHITFLDTPGHEAFTAMRARGAQVTDIAIIIIAADDSVMPTTREAIAHAQAANVPMVFAINKIDKPGANPEKIKEDLANMNLLVEDWGGKYQCQEISAKKGIGVDDLLEKVLLEAELLDLKANPNRKATGSIIESTLDKGRGFVATVLVANGTLKVGDIVLAGTYYGRIKAMFNERNQRVEKAGPSEPVIILGLNGAPQAGDTFHVMDSDQEAREITSKREQLQREQGLRTQTRLTLDEIGHRIALGSFKELNLIVKGDVDGSVEALSDSLIKLSTEKIQVNVIYKAVGQISESDVSLASVSDAIIVGFQVRPSGGARKMAEQDGVDIRTYSVIYDAIEEVKTAMEGMLEKVVKEEVTATIEVREVFHISKVGMVAGAMVKEGKVKRTDKARLIRDGIVIYTGNINALKRFKDDVKEVATNFECGISLTNCNDIKVGDVIEAFQEIEIKQSLD
ncbi:MAG: translation initiation factor IF-2 [Bacteroidaceae bacterium]|nr:translation initiation factor IF-2 [Bacteroidaceae bacterium]